MKFPKGKSDFKAIITEGFTFVDKSLFIKDIINDDSEISLITRPRRFGKTLNLSMLYYFFTNQNSAAHAKLFAGLKIEQETALFAAHQGKHPVIYVSLRDIHKVNFANFDKAYEHLVGTIQKLFIEHKVLLTSEQLDEYEKLTYSKLLQKTASRYEVETSLRFLSDCLYKHYEQKVIILIDEYDTPILASHEKYLDEMISFIQTFYSVALKDNPYLFKGVMTGILPVTLDNGFSGLNNLEAFTLLNSQYGDYFGFTESEAYELLAQTELINSATAIKAWYNGYTCGQLTIYNPWSIINCLMHQGTLQAYWVNISGNDLSNGLIKKVLSKASSNVKQQFEQLLLNTDATIAETINNTLNLTEVMQDEQALWSLLVFSGYLKVISSQRRGLDAYCQLSIPNQEVQLLYQNNFENLLVANISNEQ